MRYGDPDCVGYWVYESLVKAVNDMIKDATFTSVWDSCVKISTNCKVNIDTKEVFDIEISDVCGVEVLDIEYVTIDDVDHPVSSDGGTEFWYE